MFSPKPNSETYVKFPQFLNFYNNRMEDQKNNGTGCRYRPPVHPFTLSFTNPNLEKNYQQQTSRHSLTLVRISLFLAVGLYISFSWLDPIIIPEAVAEIMMIRVISCVIFLGVIYLTYKQWGIKHFQFLMSMGFLLPGLGIIGMILVSEKAGGYYYYAGLILAIMYAHSLLRIRFIYASLLTWVIVCIYIGATIYVGSTPSEIYVNNIFFLVSANIMGMFASYWLEYYMKFGYWNERILNEKSEELEKESLRKSRELDAAREMQLNMLPQAFPYCPNYQFSFSMKAASEVGGDYYDYQMTDDDTLTFGIGDATGHGLQASVMVTAIKLLFSEHAAKTDIVEFLKRASNSISLMDFRKIYMAFAIGRLTDYSLELAGAGMPPALIYRAKSHTLEQIPLKGLPLGSKTEFPYKKIKTNIFPDDVVILMTDGLSELFNSRGEILGYERVSELILEVIHKTPAEIIDHLHKAADEWLDGSGQDDDMTFFVFKRKQKAAEIDCNGQQKKPLKEEMVTE